MNLSRLVLSSRHRMDSQIIPIGGVKRVVLSTAHNYGQVLDTSNIKYAIDIVEGLSSYSEQTIWHNKAKEVTHKLVLATDPMYDLVAAHDLESALDYGFIADVELNIGIEITIGWNEIFACDHALRLVKSYCDCGSKRTDRVHKYWVFESVDNISLL